MASDHVTNTPSGKNLQPRLKQKLIQVGNYKLMSLRLGEGATAKVELAFHTILKTKVALKIISVKELAAEDAAYYLANMEREAKMMARLNHPNVARLFEVCSSGSHHFLMMELFTGGNLLDHVYSHGRLGEEEARNIFGQIISGLDHIHSRGVVHRDLKLENIMMDKTRTRVAITDFGLSTSTREGQDLHTRCGTEVYAAPELLDKASQFTKEVSSV